jgi:hypothetical protein
MQYVQYVIDNATTILAVIGGLQVAAVAIVKLTPTQKDDAILAKVLPYVEKFAAFLSVRAAKHDVK